MTETNNKSIILTLIILLMALGMVYIDEAYFKCPKEAIKTDTVYHERVDTIRHVDTVTVAKPYVRYVNLLRRDTFYTSNGSDTILAVENKQYIDTLACEQDSIILKSYITGVNSSLDSIKADWRRQDRILTKETIITKTITEKQHKLSISPQIGIGYGIFNSRPDVYIGVGLSYNF